jgi:hypothetical protein
LRNEFLDKLFKQIYTIARGRSYFPKFQHPRNPVSSKIPGFFSANYAGGQVLGNMRWVCFKFNVYANSDYCIFDFGGTGWWRIGGAGA